MAIFCVANEKGGAGKSVQAANTAGWLTQNSDSVMLVDLDPMNSASEWYEYRTEYFNGKDTEDKISCCVLKGDCYKQIIKFSELYDHVVVDCGGHHSDSMLAALLAADIIIMPFRPKRRDLRVAPKMLDVLRSNQVKNKDAFVFALITQCPTLPSQIRRILSAKSCLRDVGFDPDDSNDTKFHTLDHFISNRNVYDDCDENGLTIYEYGVGADKYTREATKKAKTEFEAVMSEIGAIINE